MNENTREFGGDFVPQKRWGQNFLIDPNITRKILAACSLKPDDLVLEIGPGKGALTQEIAGRVGHLFAVEKDQRLCAQLRQRFSAKNVTIIPADFLKYNLDHLPRPLKVIGNLPYYICSPIIVRLLEHRELFTDLFLTVQLEFGRRLTASVATKNYSALSCFVQFYTEPRLLFKIKNTCFHPVPQVDSCFVRLHTLPGMRFKVENQTFLFRMIRLAFQQRRKNILNALSGLISKETLQRILDSLQVSARARPEDLTILNYVQLTNALIQQGFMDNPQGSIAK